MRSNSSSVAVGDDPSVDEPGRAQPSKRRDQEVLEAAALVFHRRGYADATVQDVADELGILKGSVYYYIDSKEDLLFRLLSETHEEVEQALREVEAMPDLAPLDRLREYVLREVGYTARNVRNMAVYHRDIDQLTDEHRREIYRNRLPHEQFVTRMVEEAQARGEVDPAEDAHVLMNLVFGAMVWVHRWFRDDGPMGPDQVAEACADFVVRGLSKR